MVQLELNKNYLNWGFDGRTRFTELLRCKNIQKTAVLSWKPYNAFYSS